VAAALEKELGVTAELKVGPSGSFFVDVDGKVVVEKAALGFPEEDEIVVAVGRALGKT
jgi:selenoprotein W-related protein